MERQRVGPVVKHAPAGADHDSARWPDRAEQDRVAARVYVSILKGTKMAQLGFGAPRMGLAHEWGFGFVDLVPPKHSGPKGLAVYLAKYVCKTSDSGRPELAETVAHPDVPKRPIYISRELTRITRCTMRNLRLRRYYWQARTCRQAGVTACWYAEDMWERGLRGAKRISLPISPWTLNDPPAPP